MARRIREHAWHATDLGPVTGWSQGLRTAIDIALTSPFPTLVLWGRDLTQIYNDAYGEILGNKHPAALGQSTRTCWPELWHLNERIYRRVLAGETVTFEDRLLPVYRYSKRENAWFTTSHSPLRNEASEIQGVLVTAVETTALHRARSAQLESEKRFRALVSTMSYSIFRISPDWTEVRELHGRDMGTGSKHPDTAEWLRSFVDSRDRDSVHRAIESARGHRSAFQLEHRIRREDGTVGWAWSRVVPLLAEDGTVSEWFGASSDVSDRKRAEMLLQASEALFRQFGEASTDVLWVRNADNLHLEYLSPAFKPVFGISRSRALGEAGLMAWNELIHPEDRRRYFECIDQVRGGARLRQEFRIIRPPDGAVRWIDSADFPIVDEHGTVRRIGGIAQDITEIKSASRRLQILVAELQHRTRNILAVVHAVFMSTLRGSAALEGFRERFLARLGALARAHGLLSRLEEGHGVTFSELVRKELAGLGVLENEWAGPNVSLRGPHNVPLRSSDVQTLALALHELATNALKYGALAHPGGRLLIDWHVTTDESPALHVDWVESGYEIALTADGKPPRMGFGRELIEKSLPYELGARTHYQIDSSGVRCSILLPLSQDTLVEQPRAVTPYGRALSPEAEGSPGRSSQRDAGRADRE